LIFFANVLVMNGGTTFLIRTCREMASRGTRCAVLLLRPEFDVQLRTELERYAEVLCLNDFLIERGRLFRAHLGVFGYVRWSKLKEVLSAFGDHIHVMSIFGLVFALRMYGRLTGKKITVGVYHQNEFLFKAPPFFFAREAIRLFSAMPAENLVFFNEVTRQNYECFFHANYSASIIVPIGIDLPHTAPFSCSIERTKRIVSVGNLVKFKTYNAHMIRLTSQLAATHPDIHYDIYGTGPEESLLRALAVEHKVEERVRFMGAVPYSQFRQTINGATLFVGSGTAVIEAAAVGVPAMVGIESIETPDTYGFLSDIKGLSYNENVSSVSKHPMIMLVERLFLDSAFHASVSEACHHKAREFSVEKTVDGFLALSISANAVACTIPRLRFYRMLVSFFGMAVCERLGWITAFGDRRNQSF
jgi:glycosyltransferase involved in cell wall biosynthesis